MISNFKYKLGASVTLLPSNNDDEDEIVELVYQIISRHEHLVGINSYTVIYQNHIMEVDENYIDCEVDETVNNNNN